MRPGAPSVLTSSQINPTSESRHSHPSCPHTLSFASPSPPIPSPHQPSEPMSICARMPLRMHSPCQRPALCAHATPQAELEMVNENLIDIKKGITATIDPKQTPRTRLT
eukprot:1469038-Pyramimonas_sp.AAC.1